MINNMGSINLSSSPGCSRTAHTKANVLTTKQQCLDQKRVSTSRLAVGMKISKSSIHRILREDLGYFPCKKVKQPKLTDLQKEGRELNLRIGF